MLFVPWYDDDYLLGNAMKKKRYRVGVFVWVVYVCDVRCDRAKEATSVGIEAEAKTLVNASP
jgi:hypothetical protein